LNKNGGNKHLANDAKKKPPTKLIFIHKQALQSSKHWTRRALRVVGGRCLAQYEKVQSAHSHTVSDKVHQLHVQQPSTYEKPEAASAVLGS
jgi:hypothetical protein